MQILFFASIREQLDCSSREMEVEAAGIPVSEVLVRLVSENPAWRRVLERDRLLVAVNQEVAEMGTIVCNQDELAFFPPVTGG